MPLLAHRAETQKFYEQIEAITGHRASWVIADKVTGQDLLPRTCRVNAYKRRRPSAKSRLAACPKPGKAQGAMIQTAKHGG